MNTVQTIDACGLSCPQPVLLTRQALQSLTQGTLQVLVDSPTARDNVVRMAQKSGWHADIQEQADGIFRIALTQ